MKAFTFSLLCLAGLVMWGCGSKQAYVPLTERVSTVESQPESSVPGEKQRSEGITEEELMRRETERRKTLDEAERRRLALRDIYFDFDSYVIRPDALPALNNLGDWLKANKDVKLVIEGHCDERGTIEYNLALGQRRAYAVKEYLVRFGVEGKRLRAISYGKEMPVDPRRTDEAYAMNRRVHFRATDPSDDRAGITEGGSSYR